MADSKEKEPAIFTHLHVHSNYSDGLASPLELVLHAKALGFTHLALTDHTTLDGHAAFINACTLHQIIPILGVEISVTTPFGIGHNLLLTQSESQYIALRDVLRKHRRILLGDIKGLGIVTSGCLGGGVAKHLKKRDYWAARDLVLHYHQELGEDFYLEVQPTFGVLLAWMLSLAKELSMPFVVTNDVHYLRPEDGLRHQNAG